MPSGVFVLRDPAVKIASVDLSVYVAEVSVEMSVADVDVTASGAGGRQRIPGIRDDQFVMSMFSDFAAAKVDATLWPLFNGGSLFLVEVWPSGTVTAATNPKYSGTCLLTTYQPLSGAIGDAARTPINLPVNGVIAKATS